MKARVKADWAVALLIFGGFFLWSRSKKATHTKVEVITTKGRLYLVEPEEVPSLQTKIKAAGESIRSVRTVTK